MDVNGTKYHLLYGCNDWGRCIPDPGDKSMADLWKQPEEKLQPPLEWNGDYLRLRRLAPLFRHAPRNKPDERLEMKARRGAGRDQYGHFYWINPEEDGIHFLANGAQTSVVFWSSIEAATECEVTDQFAPCEPLKPPALSLRGLAVTKRHYLVVGNLTQKGILIFDLHRGGPPILMLWGEETAFAPWDIAATPDGGLLILDADNRRYWRLDEHFRLAAQQEDGGEALFQPVDPSAPPQNASPTFTPLGFALPDEVEMPISIEPGPEGHVLILDATANADDPSEIHELEGEMLVHTYSLKDAIIVADPDQASGAETTFSISAHDFVYVECCAPQKSDPEKNGQTQYGQKKSEQKKGRQGRCAPTKPCAPAKQGQPKQSCDECLDLSFPHLAKMGWGCEETPDRASQEEAANQPIHLLYVAQRDGNQVVAFVMDRGDPLDLIALPDYLPLRRFVGKALLGYGGKVYYDFKDRFVPLQVLVECHFAGRAVIRTPLDFKPDIATNEVITGRPFDSNIHGCVWHRLFLDADIPLGASVRVRARAADDLELLSATPWGIEQAPYLRSNGAEIPFYTPPAFQEHSESAGTWELLFQEINGRYLQLELTIEGTGRNTPELYALRVWYPRFSYLDHYMPAIYREEPVPASFLDRWLANFEGFYTYLEDQIEQMPHLLDARTAPTDALDWLACWFGLVLDPLWQEKRKRFFIQHAFQLYGIRGTVAGLEIALRLYVDEEFGEWFFDPACWGRSKVRIIEQFWTAGGKGIIYGDTLIRAGVAKATFATISSDFAHRFTVLIPHDLTVEDEQMVERIIHLEKPTHTEFELKRYWDLFRVGEARLGIDTQLGDSGYITALMLGEDGLGVHYLAAQYPDDVNNRLVLERDHLGDLPLF